MRVSPGIHYAAPEMWSLEDNIDFWYKSINMCYDCNAAFDITASYVQAISDEDSE